MSVAGPGPVRAENIISLLPYVVENHDRVRAAKAGVVAARNRAREALGAWFPTFEQTANIGHESQNNFASADSGTGFAEYDLKLTQLLWDFGVTNAAVEKARLSVDESKFNLITARQTLILEATNAYMDVIKAKQVLDFAKQSETNIRKQTGLEEALVGLGSGFSTDVLQAKRELAGAETRRSQNEGALITALNAYRKVFGALPADLAGLEKAPYPASDMPISLNTAIDTALEKNPGVKLQQIKIAQTRQDVRSARGSGFFPKLEWIGERKVKNNVGGTLGLEHEALAKFEVKLPFNLGFTAVNTLRAAKSDLSSAEFTAGDTKRNIEEQVRNAWESLETSKRTAASLLNQANIAGAFLELARNERKLGRRSLIDVLSGETALINAQSDAAGAEADVIKAAYSVLNATGQLDYDIYARSRGIKAPIPAPQSPTAVPTTTAPATTGDAPATTPAPAPTTPVTPAPANPAPQSGALPKVEIDDRAQFIPDPDLTKPDLMVEYQSQRAVLETASLATADQGSEEVVAMAPQPMPTPEPEIAPDVAAIDTGDDQSDADSDEIDDDQIASLFNQQTHVGDFGSDIEPVETQDPGPAADISDRRIEQLATLFNDAAPAEKTFEATPATLEVATAETSTDENTDLADTTEDVSDRSDDVIATDETGDEASDDDVASLDDATEIDEVAIDDQSDVAIADTPIVESTETPDAETIDAESASVEDHTELAIRVDENAGSPEFSVATPAAEPDAAPLDGLFEMFAAAHDALIADEAAEAALEADPVAAVAEATREAPLPPPLPSGAEDIPSDDPISAFGRGFEEVFAPAPEAEDSAPEQVAALPTGPSVDDMPGIELDEELAPKSLVAEGTERIDDPFTAIAVALGDLFDGDENAEESPAAADPLADLAPSVQDIPAPEPEEAPEPEFAGEQPDIPSDDPISSLFRALGSIFDAPPATPETSLIEPQEVAPALDRVEVAVAGGDPANTIQPFLGGSGQPAPEVDVDLGLDGGDDDSGTEFNDLAPASLLAALPYVPQPFETGADP